jgi:hypothetical protein
MQNMHCCLRAFKLGLYDISKKQRLMKMSAKTMCTQCRTGGFKFDDPSTNGFWPKVEFPTTKLH